LKDLATLPFRAAKAYAQDDGLGKLNLMNASITPLMAGVVGGGVVFVGGAKYWPMAVAFSAGFSYSMDMLVASSGVLSD